MRGLIPMVLFCLLLIFGCSSDGPTNSEPEAGPLAEATIGPSGGTLETSDFALTVPNGAFSQQVTLRLFDDTTTVEGAVSSGYRLEGLPDEISQPLSARIRYDGTLPDSGIYLAAGTRTYNASLDTFVTAFRMFEATDSSGYLQAALPPVNTYPFATVSAAKRADHSSQGPLAVYFVGVAGYDTPIVRPHFRIVFPSDLGNDPRTIMPDLLEHALDTVVKAGFSLANVPMPIEVYATSFHPLDNARHCMFYPAWGAFTLVLDKATLGDFLTNGQFIKGATTREVAHTVLCTYDRQYFDVILPSKAKCNPAHLWLHHAMASWFEERMVGTYDHSEGFSPLDFDRSASNQRQPFLGVQSGSGSTPATSRKHGGGMSALMKYLEIYYGQSYAWRICTDLQQHHSHPVTALRASVAEAPDIWYPDFVKTYIRGNSLYGGPWEDDLWPGSLDGDYIISTSADSLASFAASYPDLSTRIYLVEIVGQAIDSMVISTASASVETADRRLLIFGYKDAPTDHFLAEGYDTVCLHRVDTLQAQSWSQLWVAVVNSSFDETTYTGSADIQLNMKASFKDVPDFNRCLPWYTLLGTFRTITYNPPGPPDTSSHIQLTWPNWPPVRGAFTGNEFVASWDTVDANNLTFKGELSATFNEDYTLISSFTVSAEIHRPFEFVDYIEFAGVNLPLYHDIEDDARYRVDGTSLCGHITTLSDTTLNSTGTSQTTLEEVVCDVSSWAELYFFKEE